MTKIWRFRVVDHKMIDFPKEQYAEYLLNLKNGFYEFILRKQSKQRSIEQNKYYWAVVVKILAEHFGYMPEEMHGVLKFHFVRTLGCDSSTELSTYEFSIEFIEKIRTWAQTEFNVYIPAPGEFETS